MKIDAKNEFDSEFEIESENWRCDFLHRFSTVLISNVFRFFPFNNFFPPFHNFIYPTDFLVNRKYRPKQDQQK